MMMSSWSTGTWELRYVNSVTINGDKPSYALHLISHRPNSLQHLDMYGQHPADSMSSLIHGMFSTRLCRMEVLVFAYFINKHRYFLD